jgi:CubicO group peptidase (beta-lactamase class C family)
MPRNRRNGLLHERIEGDVQGDKHAAIGLCRRLCRGVLDVRKSVNVRDDRLDLEWTGRGFKLTDKKGPRGVHLGSRIATPFGPGELLLGTPGYTFGPGFAVRPGGGIAGVPGSAGEFIWAGYAGTYFWVDPKEELTAVYMSQAPSPIRAYYRKLVKQLVYGALSD